MTEASFPSRSVLCVTSHGQTREALERALAAYRPAFADGAGQAIALANSTLFDAFIIDYWLPDWSGTQLCRHMRESDPHVPIVIVNGANQTDNHKRALRAGASAFFVKPLDCDALRTGLAALMQHCDVKSARAKVEEQLAVQDELMRQRALVRARLARAADLAVMANERIARAKALQAFIEAGGTRSHFDRWWPQLYTAETERTQAEAVTS